MIKTLRILFILFVIFVSAIILPSFYDLSFEQRVITPSVYYSSVNERFIVRDYNVLTNKFTYVDREGTEYSQAEADSLLPLTFYRVLASKNALPDSLRGLPLDYNEIRINTLFNKVKPYMIDAPAIPLYPLMESNPPRFQLELPKDVFRFTDRLEFIDTHTNTVDEEKTKKYNDALLAQGFTAPAKGIFGNPSTRKPFDEGYFIVDANDDLFHLKRVDGEPVCVNTNFDKNVKIKHFAVSENSLKEFYGLIVSESNELYLLTYKNYYLQKLPVSEYDYKVDEVQFRGNIFFRTIALIESGQQTCFATDRDYTLVDSITIKWPTEEDHMMSEIKTYIFPFHIKMENPTTVYKVLKADAYNMNSIWLNVLLVLIAFFIKLRTADVKNNIIPLVVVLFTGIYGFISLLIFNDRVL